MSNQNGTPPDDAAPENHPLGCAVQTTTELLRRPKGHTTPREGRSAIRVLARYGAVQVAPASAVTTTAAGSAVGSEVDKPKPTPTHEVTDGHETPSRPTADAGTK